ncbi:unnamed protein product [Symbiodinium microadriaticum]|nr:unnamed protein product [Symbiodinium sp. KB8]CAE7566330.1 unnamed protein product [Symbiodinium microadriaticum]
MASAEKEDESVLRLRTWLQERGAEGLERPPVAAVKSANWYWLLVPGAPADLGAFYLGIFIRCHSIDRLLFPRVYSFCRSVGGGDLTWVVPAGTPLSYHCSSWDSVWCGLDNKEEVKTGKVPRPPSPSWHRRERKARSAARYRLRHGIYSYADWALLAQHHGSMPPQTKQQPSAKAPKGRGKGAEGTQQVSKVEFALPPAMVTSLQAITSRSTQDLWGMPTSVPGDLSVEQQAQRRASAVGKLSKRISGDLKAKEELYNSLQQWVVTLAIHLAGLVQRVRALGDKVDADLMEALGEMRTALEQQPSLTTAEQVATATEAVGKPIWNVIQEQEVLRIAAALRAFSVVEVPARPAETESEISFGGAPTSSQGSLLVPASAPVGSMRGDGPLVQGTDFHRTGAHVAPDTSMAGDAVARPSRWKRSRGAEGSRPSKSPRRSEPPATPWPATATGMTPEALQRDTATPILDGPGPTGGGGPLSWESAWRQLLLFALEQGGSLIGETTRDTPQDAVLPLQDTADHRQDVMEFAEAAWQAMLSFRDGDGTEAFAPLCLRLQELLNQLRMCPSSLSGARQGAVLLAQVTVGNILDPFSFAPSTAQEWLFPAAVVEHGGLLRGHIAAEASSRPEMQVLLSRRCPAFWEADDGIAELF